MNETRVAPGRGRAEVRKVGDGTKREFIARVMVYNTVDDYGTIWAPGCFKESLSKRMPVVAWAHSWTEPVGRYREVVKDDGQVLELLGKLSDFDAVPRARQAWAQMDDGTIDQFSVGFTRRKWLDGGDLSEQDRAAGAVERMLQADLDEASPVLVGAVPGTALIGTRGARRLGPGGGYVGSNRSNEEILAGYRTPAERQADAVLARLQSRAASAAFEFAGSRRTRRMAMDQLLLADAARNARR